jgi:DNA repair protein RecN (Recombination protein N)
MLASLSVRDFAVIAEASFELDPGLTVLTGETGAGKSILIGALQLLLGERASAELVRGGSERAVVEGRFLLPADHPVRPRLEEIGVPWEEEGLLVRREVTAEGRSRAFLNDTAVTVGTLKALGEELVDLHGQHEHQSLLQPANHLLLLDAWAGLEPQRDAYLRLLEELRTSRERLEGLRLRAQERAERRELHAFQLGEIDALDPRAGEEGELEAEVRILEGAQRLQTVLSGLIQTVSEGPGALADRLDRLEDELKELAGLDPKLEGPHRLVGDARLALLEAGLEARRYLDGFESDPERLLALQERLSALIRLGKKYGGSFEAMLERRGRLRELLRSAEADETEQDGLRERVDGLVAAVSTAALELSRRRKETAADLQVRIEGELEGLAMPGARFLIEVSPNADPEGLLVGPDGTRFVAGAGGIDQVLFKIATDPGMAPLPLQRVASGGEVSRIMLAIKSVFGKASRVPTLVFDEIDSGIGGRTADRVGARLEALAGEHQVLVITHLPQIARRGRTHLVVEKKVSRGRARTSIRRLEGDERTQALAVLMGGESAGEDLLRQARQLLGVADSTEDRS